MLNSNYLEVSTTVRPSRTTFIQQNGVARATFWDANKAYLERSLVLHSGYLYAAITDVPAGTQLSNTTYWQPLTYPQELLLGKIDSVRTSLINLTNEYTTTKSAYEQDKTELAEYRKVINAKLSSLDDNKLDKPDAGMHGTKILAVKGDAYGNSTQELLTLVVDGDITNTHGSNFTVVGRNRDGIAKVHTPPDNNANASDTDIINRSHYKWYTPYKISLSVDSDYKLKAQLINGYGNPIATSNVIDLPIESLISNIRYDEESRDLIITLQNGTQTAVPLDTLVDSLNTSLDNKVDKIGSSGYYMAYAVQPNGAPDNRKIVVNDGNLGSGALPSYQSNTSTSYGKSNYNFVLATGEPKQPYHATPMAYVDRKVDERLLKIEPSNVQTEAVCIQKFNDGSYIQVARACTYTPPSAKSNNFTVPFRGTEGDLKTKMPSNVVAQTVPNVEYMNTQLGTKVGFEDLATTEKYGVVKINPSLGISVSGSAMGSALQVEYATENDIKNRASYRKSITPPNLDIAVKEGVVNNSLTLTDEEKANAQAWLGVTGGSNGKVHKHSVMLETPVNEFSFEYYSTSATAISTFDEIPTLYHVLAINSFSETYYLGRIIGRDLSTSVTFYGVSIFPLGNSFIIENIDLMTSFETVRDIVTEV